MHDRTDTAMSEAFESAGIDSADFHAETGDHREHHGACVTAAACEHARLFGAAPGPDEPDTREIWDEDDALAGIAEAFRILGRTVSPDGTQLADEREDVLWSFVNMWTARKTLIFATDGRNSGNRTD